jgi:hypothetical protein
LGSQFQSTLIARHHLVIPLDHIHVSSTGDNTFVAVRVTETTRPHILRLDRSR